MVNAAYFFKICVAPKKCVLVWSDNILSKKEDSRYVGKINLDSTNIN